ncbi:Flp pilus assembly protein CpaB [Paraburkholderia fungorum]|uniref:Flp pilus assembly protein CpaB n=1 Tax=Paraburkholderia fungorum TaxID=134537 RepID=UPI0038BD7A6A
MLKKINLRSLLGNSWVLLILAVLIAGGLTFLLYKYLTDRENKLKADMAARRVSSGIEVVVPAQDVPVGTPLSSSDFVSREIAPDLVYDDMIRADSFPQYRSSRLVKAVRRGLPLRAGDIDALRGRDFSDILPAGQRAVTVEIDTVNSTALMVRPGNRVDVYWVGKTFSLDHSSDETKMAQLIMQNVLVLATGQDMRPRDAGEAMEHDQANANSSAMSRQDGMGYTTVTLQVPADDAPRIALAQKIGGLRIILRNADDHGVDVPVLVKESDVFMDVGRKKTTASASAATVEVIAGGGANSTVLTPQGASSGGQDTPPAAAPAPANAVRPTSSAPSDTAVRRPSVYEQANAIAQQLQKAVAPSASKQN